MSRRLQEIVFETASFLNRSPVAEHAARKPLPVSALTGELAEMRIDMQTIADKLVQPLKLAILGEVKAGKSTLINTLIGADVSPVDAKEATAAIISIHHREEPTGRIIFHDGTIGEGTPDDIRRIMNEKRGDLAFFSRIKTIELGLPLPNLRKLHLVDTPGLATITRQNEETTTRFLQEADVVLWVLNANHLGQSDVEEALGRTAKMGKPVIGILNRIDEADGDPGRLVDYVEQELGIYLQRVFPLSARQAHAAMQGKDHAKLRESGYLDLLGYLESRIEAKVEAVHRESIIRSVLALLRKNHAYHDSYRNSLRFLRAQVKEHRADLEYHNQRIKQELEEDFRHWAEYEFLRSEKQEVQAMIEDMKLLSGKAYRMDIETRLRYYFSPDNINRQIDLKLKELHLDMQRKWQEALDSVQERRMKQFEEFARQEEQQLQLSLREALPSGKELATEGAGMGAAIAGAWGVAAAAYAAWLGPSAAAISLGVAAAAILPPLLIAGAATGAVAKLIGFRKQKQRFQQALEEAFRDAKRELAAKMVPNVVASIRQVNDDFADGVNRKFVEMMANGNSEEEIQALEFAITQYLEENQRNMNRWDGEVENSLQSLS
jgi:small GTP-binding protein